MLNHNMNKAVARAIPASYAYAHRKGILGGDVLGNGGGVLGHAGIIARGNEDILNEINKQILEPKIEVAARVAFEAQKAYSKTIEPDLHDEKNVTWEDLPEKVKEQLKSGTKRIIDSLLNGSYTNSDMEAVASHNKWLSNKLKDGYKYGEIIDHENKTHSNLLPFEELNAEQQFKSILFVQIVEIFYTRILSETEEFFK